MVFVARGEDECVLVDVVFSVRSHTDITDRYSLITFSQVCALR